MSVAVVVLSLFAPGSLLIFTARPDLYSTIGVNGVMLVSAGISAPLLMLAFMIAWTPLSTMRETLKARERPEATSVKDLDNLLTADDPLEWPCLIGAAWVTNFALTSLAARAYFNDIQLGASLFSFGGFLLVVWTGMALFSVGWKLRH